MSASVHRRDGYAVSEPHPLADQHDEFGGLTGMLVSDAFENEYLVPHQAKVGDRVNALLLDALDVAREGSTAQHYALVGFVWGHATMLGKEVGGNKPS